ncbi:hypothetical protein SLS58_004603 [Diplodia intermedia]|uniref:RING-type domain-containing protein n=1 Tax=Diplodia intermedia TaxID=856260 RepID=A0ABR3TTT2_9PEZI
MPRFDELLAHYPILCSLAPEITSRDLFAVASTSKAAWVSIFKEETSVGSAPSAQALARLTQCEGLPGRVMVGKQVTCSDEMDLCERCGCNTCSECRAKWQMICPGLNPARQGYAGMTTAQAAFLCDKCRPTELTTHHCACDPEDIWFKPWICSRCALDDVHRRIGGRHREEAHWFREGFLDTNAFRCRERTYFSEPYDPEPDTVLYVRSCMGCSSKFGDVWMNTYCHFCKGVIFDQGIWEANINIAGKRCRVVRTVRDFLTLENTLKLRIH